MPPPLSPSTSSRQLSSLFYRYERDRYAFVSGCAEASRNESNAAALVALGAPALLTSLLQADPVPSVALTAACALGRLAGHMKGVATTLASAGAVATLVGC